MNYKQFNFPDNLFYNKDYSWVRRDKDKIVTVGVTDLGAKLVKQFVFVDLPKLKDVKQGEVYVSLESVKWSGHLKSPISGRVVEVNNELIDSPELINQDPYGRGWIMRVEVSDLQELKSLLTSRDIVSWLNQNKEVI